MNEGGPATPGAHIEEQPEFKVGDRVQREAVIIYGEHLLRGTVKDVKRMEDGLWVYNVEWDATEANREYRAADERNRDSIGYWINHNFYYTPAGIGPAQDEGTSETEA